MKSRLGLMETREEAELTLQCARKIRKHLIRLVNQEGKSQFTVHLRALEAQISPIKV